ncbi:PREDICTED: uncharacterized protein LOC109230164 [Nicotiana attenuata]|nr:PREDICTED: uncharacterized protein LOC109230164 [Nicotiana attenuata]
MHEAASNVNDKIWVFWDKEFTAKVLDHDEQQLSLEMKHVENGNLFHLTVIYAKCKPVLRRPLWEVLRQKSTNCSVPWCVIGDFNIIASVEKKIGGIPYQMSKSLDFLSMMEDCGLVDLGFYGPKVTWSNGRGNVLLYGKEYGDIFQKPKEFEQKVKDVEMIWTHTNNDTDRATINELKAQYVRHLKVEQEVLKHKTQLKWFKEGDANSRYFHSLIRGRRKKLFIHKIKNEEGEWIQGDENIGKAACGYFQDLFTDPGSVIREDLLSIIPTMISSDDNAIPTKDPSMTELKEIVFSMNPSSHNQKNSSRDRIF